MYLTASTIFYAIVGVPHSFCAVAAPTTVASTKIVT